MNWDHDASRGAVPLLETLAAASILAPPLGRVALPEVESFGDWSWGTRHVDEEDLYMFDVKAVLDAIVEDGPFFALCHAGHGINSYGLNLVTASGAVAAFVQHGWGGVYMDPLQATLAVNKTYARLHELFRRIAEPSAGVRWLLVCSTFRAVCGVVDLAKYQSTGALDASFASFSDTEAPGRSGEVALFEFLLAQPGLVNKPSVRESDWA